MKKLFFLFSLIMCCTGTWAQESSSAFNCEIISRAEYSSMDETNNLGLSSFYALFDGDLSERFSYSASFHLLSPAVKDLYTSSFRSDAMTICDWAYLQFNLGNVNFSLGKDIIVAGTFEMDDFDFNLYNELTMAYWNTLPVSEWCARVNWDVNENILLSAQMTTSPFGERPFASGLFTYNIRGYFDYEVYQGMAAMSFMQMEPRSFFKLLSIGNRFNIGDWQLTWDSSYCITNGKTPMTQLFYASWNATDKLKLTGKFGINTVSQDEDSWLEWKSADIVLGAIAEWQVTENFGLHALAGYESLTKRFLYNAGASFKFSF